MAKSRVIVEFPDRAAYTVRIGGGVAAQLGADLRAAGVTADRCLVVCDAEAASRCLPPLKESLAASGFRVNDIAVPAIEPADAWACAGELLGALSQMNLPQDAPVIVCAGVEVAELAAFAFSLQQAHPLVLVPASLAAALRVTGVDAVEVDVGFASALRAKLQPAFAALDGAFLACEHESEADMGLYELEQAAVSCDAEFQGWLSENLGDVAAYDEEALVLALTQALAARADAIGQALCN